MQNETAMKRFRYETSCNSQSSTEFRLAFSRSFSFKLHDTSDLFIRPSGRSPIPLRCPHNTRIIKLILLILAVITDPTGITDQQERSKIPTSTLVLGQTRRALSPSSTSRTRALLLSIQCHSRTCIHYRYSPSSRWLRESPERVQSERARSHGHPELRDWIRCLRR
jgi:hypothetical protein